MNTNRSPEEKLLELIRNDSPFAKRMKGRPKIKLLALLFGMMSRFAGFLKKLISPVSLYVLCTVSMLLFLISLIYSPYTTEKRSYRYTPKLEEGTAPIIEEIKEKPFDFYLAQIRNNDIFSLAKKDEPKSDALLSGLKDITLVGIISEDPPQAIIKDRKNNATYFLQEGEVLGQIKVRQILQGRIVVEYKGQMFEVHL